MAANEITLFLVEPKNSEQWPLPQKYEEQERDVSATGGILNPIGWDENSWENDCKGDLSNRYYNVYNSKYFKIYRDTNFQVGPDKKRFYGHRLILSVECENQRFRNALNKSFEDRSEVALPGLDPNAFKEALDYIYKRDINFQDVSEARNILKVAAALGIQQLMMECTEFLSSKLSQDNAVGLLCYALELCTEDLKDNAASFITRNIFGVLSSDGFLELSLENLKTFLQNDDWFINDELHVFESVIRWAKKKFLSNSQEQGKTPSGGDLRNILEDATYQIRLTSLTDANEFLILQDKHDGFFYPSEIKDISFYLAAKAKEKKSRDRGEACPAPRPPSNFNMNPRIRRKVEQLSSPIEETTESVLVNIDETCQPTNGTFGSPIPNTDESSQDSKYSNVGLTSMLHTTSEIDSSTMAIDDSSLDHPPPKKRKKRVSTGTFTQCKNRVPSPLTATVTDPLSSQSNRIMNLHDYVSDLAGKENNTELIKKIDKVVKIPSMPQLRVYLPNLKEFNLTLIRNTNRNFECGTTLKNYIKPKLAHLSEILFFDTNKPSANLEGLPGETFQSQRSKIILKELLSMKVNITITCANLMVLKVNHEEGIILMNLIKDAQQVLNGAGDFPLKVLLVGDCEIFSLEPVRRDCLKVIVMRRVRGLKNHANFLQSCTNLRTVAWNDLGSEELNFNETLLNKNPHLEKLSLAKCKLTVTEDLNEHVNFLRELYLDNCDFKPGMMPALPKLFPYVKRVQIYGKQADTRLLHNILKMESLQWLFVWEFVYYKVKSSRKQKGSIMTEESKELQEFLAAVFDTDFSRKEKCTFILEKKEEFIAASPSTSSSALHEKVKTPFDASCWKGTKLNTLKEKYDAISKLDFRHFSYDKFFPSFNDFLLFEKTEADLKKEKSREKHKVGSTMNNLPPSNDDSLLSAIDIMEPASNSSTSTCDDALDIMNN